MTVGLISDHTGAAASLDSLPAAQQVQGDRRYDSDWFRDTLKEKDIKPCIPGRKSRGKSVKCNERKYKGRNRSKIMFRRIKNWR